MTGNASLCGSAVIKYRYQPVGRHVAAITGQAGWNVVNAHTCSNRAIMTTRTGSRDLRMIHQRIDWCPCRAVVTGFTGTSCRYVCRASAGGNHAIVAGITATDNLCVIH